MKNVVHFEYKQTLKHDVTELLITVQYSLMQSYLNATRLCQKDLKGLPGLTFKVLRSTCRLQHRFFNVSIETTCLS